ARTSIRVGQPGGEMGSQAIDAFDRFCAARTVERGVDLAEIPDMRTMQDCGAQLRGLDRVLAAVFDQRAANEHGRCQPIDETELSHRVHEVDLRRGAW